MVEFMLEWPVACCWGSVALLYFICGRVQKYIDSRVAKQLNR